MVTNYTRDVGGGGVYPFPEIGSSRDRERAQGAGGGGALRFFFDGGVPQPTMKWGSKELTTRVKYRVLGTIYELSGRVKNGV